MQVTDIFEISDKLPLLLAGAFVAGSFCVWGFVSGRSRSQCEALANRLQAESQSRLQAVRGELQEALQCEQLRYAVLNTKCEQGELQLLKLQRENEMLRRDRDAYIKLKVLYQESISQREREGEYLVTLKKAMLSEFESSAARIFDAKQKLYSESAKTDVAFVLAPFREQLKNFNQRVEDVYHKENSQRNQLIGQISELQKQTSQVSSDANNLAEALRGDNKLQGDWGELILERVLERSGLQLGREYELQVTLKNTEGASYRPDVLVHLPGKRDVIIDAKVSMVEYERYTQAKDRESKQRALTGHVASLRRHVKLLSDKQYHQLQGINTLDFVFIFLPIEAAYLLAIQGGERLFAEAYEKNIVLTSPSSLIVALRTVESLWRNEQQNTNAKDIALSAGKLYDQFALVLKSFEELGVNLDRADQSYRQACKRLSSGKGNVLARVSSLRALGAKTSRTIPSSFEQGLDDGLAGSELNQEQEN
ncbi:MAG: DNA recombination protein RmuC [Alteromonadaceae bacterium]|nr:MAG: DNA recombination protein RmuC [Alteromonadaceae bacterium]